MLTEEQDAILRQPFPASMVGKLPRGTIKLDYVGHGAVTSRLLDADASWNWEPVATNEDGTPHFDEDSNGDYVGLWIKLTVGGVTRLGYGSVPPKTQDAAKQLIGDAIRNAAMRFGVALDLWIKGHAPDDDERNVPEGPRASGRRKPEPAPTPFISKGNVDRFLQTCITEGIPVADAVSRATDGRTVLPGEVYTTEVNALRDAVAALVAAKPAGDATDEQWVVEAKGAS